MTVEGARQVPGS